MIMQSHSEPGSPLVPHMLRLVDPGPADADGLPGAIGSLLGTDRNGWATCRSEEDAFVFPSWTLAHRFAKRFMVSTGQSWIPVAAPQRATTIPGNGTACRSCGCTEAFACPTRCWWHEPGLCSQCAVAGEELVTWVIYDKPSDHPDSAIARKFVGGVPTPDFMAAATISELRKKMPEGSVSIPRDKQDPTAVVEMWL